MFTHSGVRWCHHQLTRIALKYSADTTVRELVDQSYVRPAEPVCVIQRLVPPVGLESKFSPNPRLSLNKPPEWRAEITAEERAAPRPWDQL